MTRTAETTRIGARRVPVLMYHSVSTDASAPRRFRIDPDLFTAHLDLLAARGHNAVTVGQLADAFAGRGRLPARPVVLTFDDGFRDLHTTVLPLLRARELTATLFVTTGLLDGDAATDVPRADALPNLGPMLTWRQLLDIAAYGIEVGGHSHTHPAMDLLADDAVAWEARTCRQLLQDHLGARVRSFAYPYGYATDRVERLVLDAGYEVACGVRHAVTTAADRQMALARVEVTATTSVRRLDRWLDGRAIRHAPCPDRARTRVWRFARRGRRLLGH